MNLLLVECCTETVVGLLETGAQDSHLDFHTAPELLEELVQDLKNCTRANTHTHTHTHTFTITITITMAPPPPSKQESAAVSHIRLNTFSDQLQKDSVESLSLMLPDRTFQREGATYLKVRLPYGFVSEIHGPANIKGISIR